MTFASTGTPAVYLPLPNLMEEASDVIRLCTHLDVDAEELGTFLVNVERDATYAYTRGMSFFQLPEVEVPLEDRAEAHFELCANTAAYLLREGAVLKLGDSIGASAAPEWRVARGRRGPSADETHGPFGSIQFTRVGPK